MFLGYALEHFTLQHKVFKFTSIKYYQKVLTMTSEAAMVAGPISCWWQLDQSPTVRRRLVHPLVAALFVGLSILETPPFKLSYELLKHKCNIKRLAYSSK
jgi:hypothetical protein